MPPPAPRRLGSSEFCATVLATTAAHRIYVAWQGGPRRPDEAIFQLAANWTHRARDAWLPCVKFDGLHLRGSAHACVGPRPYNYITYILYSMRID
jgi:hypothetical protein